MTPEPMNVVGYWLQQVDLAKDREKDYRKEAHEAVQLYEGELVPQNSFNILYANTETLLPGVYNTLPRPVVRRRYLDDDPLGRAVSETLKRGLEYVLDTPDFTYTPMDDLFEQAVVGALVPSRGVIRFRYETETEQTALISAGSTIQVSEQSDLTPSEMKNVGLVSQTPQTYDKVIYETVCGLLWPWDRFLHGFARRWSDVPWIAYEHRMTKEDLKLNFPSVPVDEISLVEQGDPTEERKRDKAEKRQTEDVAVVWEVWHKSKKEVVFVSEGYKDKPLKVVPDPLRIPGFFDCVKPLSFITRNSNLTPAIPYRLYREQARELNRVTQRINKVIEAIKVRGFYDGQIKDLADLMTKPENTLVPAQGVMALMNSGSLDKHIWLMPIEKLITVLQQLYIQRQQVKQTIYEITGISDILRGTSIASETATAQNIKNQWGTLRLKRMQKQVQEFIRDCLRLSASIMAQHFSQQTWAAMTQLPFVTVEDKAAAQQTLSQLQMLMPATPPEGQQKLQQQMAVAQQTLSKMDWGQVLQVLKSDVMRSYRIDIETNSTVDPDATEDKQNITDILTAMGQALQSFGPLVEKGAMPLAVFKSLMKAIVRRYQFGPDVEQSLDAIPDQMPMGGPDQQKTIEKLQQTVADMESKLKEQQIKHNAEKNQVKQEVDMEVEKAANEQEMTHEKLMFEIEKLLDRHMMDVEGALLQAGVKAEVSAVRQEGKQQKMAARQQGVKTPPSPGPDPGLAQAVAAIQASNGQLVGAVTRLVEAFSARRQSRNVGRGPDGRLTVMNAPPSVQ